MVKPKRIVASDYAFRVCAAYLGGQHSPQIAVSLSISVDTVCQILERNNIPRRKGKLTEQQKAEICASYSNGQAMLHLALKYEVNKATIANILDSATVPRRSQSESRLLAKRKYSCDHNYFHQIDSQEKAYWLGFIAADGCVTSRNTLAICLASKDESHLARFLADLRSDHPIGRRKARTSTHNGKEVQAGEASVIQINSPQLAGDLASQGIMPAKTFKLQWPSYLSDETLRHFLRGYTDGDGCWQSLPKPSWSIVANVDFGLGAQDYVSRMCGLKTSKIYLHSNTQSCSVTRSGRFQVSRIAHLIYDDATVYLPRKFEKIRGLIPDFV